MFFTYIIQSQLDRSFYIGHSCDINQRLAYHNGGLSAYTSKKIPWELVYIKIFQTKGEANKRGVRQNSFFFDFNQLSI